MKVLTSALLLGAATAAVSNRQQILKSPSEAIKHVTNQWSKPLNDLEESLKSLTSEARAAWDEVAMMFPESMDKANIFSLPKAHQRRADHEWDHVTKGADLQKDWVLNEDEGEMERRIDGKLENYNLRTKKVDPKSLGVDKVKQYSGYLDDDEADKHLFYCKSFQIWHVCIC